jgi:uncharacterized YigZ family protein
LFFPRRDGVDEYLVPLREAESEFTEKRSRFIGRVFPVASESEARGRIEQVKRERYDARHNCWCYIIKNGAVRYGDDGEPQGTAGQPMLNVFQREGVVNVCCVVTRYFGGVLLGAGGLTRAYSKSARDALGAAGIGRMEKWTAARAVVPYSLFEQTKTEIERAGGTVRGAEYSDSVAVAFAVPDGALETLSARLTELSAGASEAVKTGEEFLPAPYIK